MRLVEKQVWNKELNEAWEYTRKYPLAYVRTNLSAPIWKILSVQVYDHVNHLVREKVNETR